MSWCVGGVFMKVGLCSTLLIVLAVACSRSGAGDLQATPGGGAAEGELVYDTRVICPPKSERYELGVEGAFGWDEVAFEWHYDSAAQASWSPMIYAEVPEGTVSLSITVDGDAPTALAVLEVGGESWIDEDWGEPPLDHWIQHGATVVLPVNAATFPAPGCLAFLPVADGNLEGHTGYAQILTRRYEAAAEALDLNLILVEGVEIYDDEIDAMIGVMDQLFYDGYGPSVGAVTLYEYAHSAGDVVCPSCGSTRELRQVTTGGGVQALNVFLVSDFTEPGILGIAGGIPGALLEGYPSSGVIVAVDSHLNGAGTTLDTQTMGETLAHEAGHQLGLFHTTESAGSHDPIGDTPECPMSQDDGDGELSGEECSSHDGPNFMFWTSASFAQDTMSYTQSDVLYYSPAVR